jgi:hypothetical protein
MNHTETGKREPNDVVLCGIVAWLSRISWSPDYFGKKGELVGVSLSCETKGHKPAHGKDRYTDTNEQTQG